MRSSRIVVIGILILTSWLVDFGCGRVPPEIVELSYRTGQDLVSIQESYDRLVHELYDQLRVRREEYLHNEWIPIFLEKFISDGKLVEIAEGKVVWSESDATFVAPAVGSEEQQLLASVNTWAGEALSQIEIKRDSLILPLNAQEDSLRWDVQRAIHQVIQANATITAHLNSLRKVQNVQDSALAGLRIKDLRDKINNAIVTASNQAAKALDFIRNEDSKLDSLVKGTHQ